MKWRGWSLAVWLVGASVSLAAAQSARDPAGGQPYTPRLGDIMNMVQTRHFKLWFAGKALNWDLAAFELRQLKEGLLEAAVIYPGIPASNITTLTNPVQSVADAIDARDGARFSKAVGELTEGCNLCHRSLGREFIVIQTPTMAPFGNQQFAPHGKP
jgi:hypothetical protein